MHRLLTEYSWQYTLRLSIISISEKIKMYKKLQDDERGVGHLLMIIVAVLVLAAIGVVGWKVASNKSSNPSSNLSSADKAVSKAKQSSCMTAYHDSKLCSFAAFSTSFNKTAYTATLKATQQGDTGSTFTIKSDGKGNTELVSTGSGQQIDAITLNGTSYIQSNGTGSWIAYPSGTSTPTLDPTTGMDIGVGSSGLAYKYLGKEACGSLTCYKYQVASSLTPGTTQYVWFDNNSYKLREWSYTDESGNLTDMVVNYSSVNITMPSPVESLTQSLGQ